MARKNDGTGALLLLLAIGGAVALLRSRPRVSVDVGEITDVIWPDDPRYREREQQPRFDQPEYMS